MLPELAIEAAKEVLPLVVDALTKGVDKETLMGAIRDMLIAASDAEMKREFPGETA